MSNPLIKLAHEMEESMEGEAIMVLDQVNKVECDTIPFGLPGIDELTGIGGIPRGRITEIFGPEGCGKTSLCLHAISQANKMGLAIGYIDSEHALSIKRIEALGIDKSKFILSQPSFGEQALEIAEMMIRSEKIAMIVIDSVAALTPKAEMDKDFGEATMGSQARLMSQAMRKLVGITGKNNIALVFTNQIRAKLGSFFPENTTTGGNALKFYASLRIKLSRIGSMQDQNGTKLASRYKMSIVKNKLAVPFREIEYCVDGKGVYVSDKKGMRVKEEQIEEE